MANLNTLHEQVLDILEQYPDTRNSDITLMIELWRKYYPQRIQDDRFKLTDLYDLPREDNIKRVRAKIQNDLHRFLPTSEEVAIKRGWAVDEWRSYLGYTPSYNFEKHDRNEIKPKEDKPKQEPTKLFDDEDLKTNTNNFRR